MKDLGIRVKSDLFSMIALKKDFQKLISYFGVVKKNVPQGVGWKSLLCLYKSKILPIITFGSMCWFLSRVDCPLVESFQEPTTKWIFNYGNTDYVTMLKVANLVPVPMFLQLLELLRRGNEAYNCHYSAFLDFCDFGNQHKKWELFVLRSPKFQQSRASFFFRTQRIMNNSSKNINFLDRSGLKKKPLNLMFQKIREEYREEDLCLLKFAAIVRTAVPSADIIEKGKTSPTTSATTTTKTTTTVET